MRKTNPDETEDATKKRREDEQRRKRGYEQGDEEEQPTKFIPQGQGKKRKAEDDLEEEEAKRGDILHWTQQKAPWIDPETGGVLEDEKVEHGMEKERKHMQNQTVLRVVTYKQCEEALRSGRKVVLVKTGWVLRRREKQCEQGWWQRKSVTESKPMIYIAQRQEQQHIA